MGKISNVVTIDDENINNFIIKRSFELIDSDIHVEAFEDFGSTRNYLKSLDAYPARFPQVIVMDAKMNNSESVGFLELYNETFYAAHPNSIFCIWSSFDDFEYLYKFKDYPFVHRYYDKREVRRMITEINDLYTSHFI